ncbi:hypothetical protein RBB50_002714 [Rhinocladiella similis]
MLTDPQCGVIKVSQKSAGSFLTPHPAIDDGAASTCPMDHPLRGLRKIFWRGNTCVALQLSTLHYPFGSEAYAQDQACVCDVDFASIFKCEAASIQRYQPLENKVPCSLPVASGWLITMPQGSLKVIFEVYARN